MPPGRTVSLLTKTRPERPPPRPLPAPRERPPPTFQGLCPDFPVSFSDQLPSERACLSKSARNARFSGLEPVRLRNSSTSVSVVRPPDKRFGSCLTKKHPVAVSRISCQRSPFELL